MRSPNQDGDPIEGRKHFSQHCIAQGVQKGRVEDSQCYESGSHAQRWFKKQAGHRLLLPLSPSLAASAGHGFRRSLLKTLSLMAIQSGISTQLAAASPGPKGFLGWSRSPKTAEMRLHCGYCHGRRKHDGGGSTKGRKTSATCLECQGGLQREAPRIFRIRILSGRRPVNQRLLTSSTLCQVHALPSSAPGVL